MSIAIGEIDTAHLNIRLRVNQAMLETTIAFLLRSGNADDRRWLMEDLRRNILITMADIEPNADQATVLTHEDAADRLLDEIVRLSCIS